jgi:site-specific DNA-methyltransferase (adenine-specific)/site-specific DNA-methyltransferase (cytosine-N4-specific)
MTNYNIINGDCFELIKQQPDNSVDLVVTSPPYSDIVNYGKSVSTKKPDDYVDWILPLFKEIHRVLKPSGSFILNINDKCENGYRSTYIYDLISRNNKETDLKLYDTYIWHKKNGIPNGSTRRFRNTTEFIFHFCKDQKNMKFYMDRALQQPADSYKLRFENDTPLGHGQVIDGKRIKIRKTNKQVDKDGLSIDEIVERTVPHLVRPDNVFRFATAGASKDNHIKHPAPFNKELPSYYINLLTDEGDVVLDPFSGIATTGMSCLELNRFYIGYELNETYCDFSIKRLEGDTDDFYCVNQYTLEDEFVKSYPNRSAAKRDNPQISEENIIRCYNGWYKSAGGYKWRLEKR